MLMKPMKEKRERTKDDIALNPAIIRISVFFMIFYCFCLFQKNKTMVVKVLFFGIPNCCVLRVFVCLLNVP